MPDINLDSGIEALLPKLFSVADKHTSERVSNAAALAADSLLLLLDLVEDERLTGRTSFKALMHERACN